MDVPKNAYLSCSPGTLRKDLLTLTQNGYEVTKLIPFDFFPQTIHVECLALLEYSQKNQKKQNTHIIPKIITFEEPK